MFRLLVVLPHRGRPPSLLRFIRSFLETAQLPTTGLAVVLDNDDPSWQSLSSGVRKQMLAGVDVSVLPRASFRAKLNYAVFKHLDSYDAVLSLGDDHVFRTPGWDRHIMDELIRVGGTGMVYVNDLGGRQDVIATNVAISTDILAALGYFAEPSLDHYSTDEVWTMLGRETGCLHYLPDVVIEHLHPFFGKAPNDLLYQETSARYWDSDQAAWKAWSTGPRKVEDIDVVRAVLEAKRC